VPAAEGTGACTYHLHLPALFQPVILLIQMRKNIIRTRVLGQSVISPLKSANYSIEAKFVNYSFAFPSSFGEEGPLPNQFHPHSLGPYSSIYAQSIRLIEKLQREEEWQVDLFCWNMHDHDASQRLGGS